MSDLELYAVPDPMIGQKIGRYVIRRKLAEGGMGAVYVATHEQLENVTKVVKTLLPMYARNPMLRDRFEREARAVSRLRHRYIVTIDDYGQLPDGQLFLMMPFLHGRSLEACLRERGRLTEHHALHILVQVCCALQYMHDSGVIHRDIKPGNIFLVEDDDNPFRVYLIDLGIAKSLAERDGVTNAGATMGTPAYMAVEQFENAAGVTPLADLYAVAIVAWELVTGRLPWGSHSTHVLYEKQKGERPTRPPEMSMEWFAILSAALAVHPDDRPQSMCALAVALASRVPAIAPHLPSGAEILAKLAPTFVHHAGPNAVTVRHASNRDRVVPIASAHRQTPATPVVGFTPPDISDMGFAPHQDAGARAIGYAAPLSGPGRTTLSASNGSSVSPPVRPSSRLPMIAAMVLVSAGGIVAYGLATRSDIPEVRPAATAGSSVTPTSAATMATVSPVLDASVADGPPPDAPLADAPPDAGAEIRSVPIVRDKSRSPIKKSTPSARSSTDIGPPNAATKPTDPRSVPHRGSGDTFNRNEAAGDE